MRKAKARKTANAFAVLTTSRRIEPRLAQRAVGWSFRECSVLQLGSSNPGIMREFETRLQRQTENRQPPPRTRKGDDAVWRLSAGVRACVLLPFPCQCSRVAPFPRSFPGVARITNSLCPSTEHLPPRTRKPGLRGPLSEEPWPPLGRRPEKKNSKSETTDTLTSDATRTLEISSSAHAPVDFRVQRAHAETKTVLGHPCSVRASSHTTTRAQERRIEWCSEGDGRDRSGVHV